MENKRHEVTPLMIERIRHEQEINKEMNKDLASILGYSEKHIPRLLSVGKNIDDKQINKLALHWGVQKTYLLGIDSARTVGAQWNELTKSQQLLLDSTNNLLNLLGISFEACEMLCFKLSDIYFFQSMGTNIEKMLSIIDPFILEPKDSWEHFKKMIKNKEIDISFEEHCFITNGSLYDFTLEEANNISNREESLENRIYGGLLVDIRYFIRNCPRVYIDGQFVGYSRNYKGNMNIIADTVKSLAISLIDDEKRKDDFIYRVANSSEKTEKETSKKRKRKS